MTNPAQSGIVIAGAGIGGLTAALALHARGLAATVLESAPEIRPLGVGINIQPVAVAELIGLGLGDALAATGIATREHRYLNHKGATLWSEPRGAAAGHPAPQYSIHRGELQTLLLDAVCERLGADAIRTGAEVRGFDQGGDRVSVQIHMPTGGATAIEADALIGADGLHSAVRARLHPDEPPVRTTAVRMWRGLAELPEFLDGRTMIIAADDRANRIVAYPCSRRHAERGTFLLNWVCLAAVPGAAASSHVGAGRLGDLLPHFADWEFDWLDIRATLGASPRILHYPMVDRDPLASWGEHLVTLLGDAAHPMYPIGANGASQAILDSVVLATELAASSGPSGLSGADDTAAALRRYEAARRPATTAIVHANRRMDRSERALADRLGGDVSGELRTITRDYRAAVEGA
ncbi:FAD-dependent monooxygenase [Streptomyces sp. MUM 178J]|uniref:FAD-dependent monooxygenase n=1 Tax=Streptomyces sp. MUM 178J TaxID=2791991 RepID=UPI001F0388A5|nr:FAD-dependent monooxygenase [Streptomyces sp. MUM 178J]WRQ83084.1 FAD-dependent monooxygenase [Streptomyces sp. MUM 178J]